MAALGAEHVTGDPVTAVSQVRHARRATAYVRDIAFRIERRATKRFSDVELRQLRSLQRAYRGKHGPELLLFGDSSMFWTSWGEVDRRHLAQMIRDEVGGHLGLEPIVGGCYNPRIIMAFLSALQTCESQPRVVVVPISVLMATSTWLGHPVLGYEQTAQSLRAVIKAGRHRPRRLDKPDDAAWEAYDRLPAPSLIGAKRTVGELRLFLNAVPASRWQHLVRLRHVMDYYNAERLEPDSPGVLLVAELATMLKTMGLPVVGHIAPVNYEMAEKLLGAGAPEHIARNAEIVATAFRDAAGELGTVANDVSASPGTEFSDPVHLNNVGRLRVATSIASAIRPYLPRGNRPVKELAL